MFRDVRGWWSREDRTPDLRNAILAGRLIASAARSGAYTEPKIKHGGLQGVPAAQSRAPYAQMSPSALAGRPWGSSAKVSCAHTGRSASMQLRPRAECRNRRMRADIVLLIRRDWSPASPAQASWRGGYDNVEARWHMRATLSSVPRRSPDGASRKRARPRCACGSRRMSRFPSLSPGPSACGTWSRPRPAPNRRRRCHRC